MKGFREQNKSKNKNKYTNTSKEDIINQADKFYSQGNTSEAEKYYQLFLNKGFSDARVSMKLGQILYNKGKIKKQNNH